MSRSTVTTICRACMNCCPMVAEIEDGRIVSLRGDPDNALWAGYSCIKGRSQHHFTNSERRLRRSLKRQPDGTFAPISIELAMDEIAERLRQISDEHGMRAIGGYWGSYAVNGNATTQPMLASFFRAFGAPMLFDASSIDKPGKKIAKALHGSWMAPPQAYDRPEVALLIGCNPFQSYYGVACGHPNRWLSDQLRRGMRLIVVDPRTSDIAKRATLHIKPVPGQDAAILAALLHVIIEEGLYDAAFVSENADGLDELRKVVRVFTPEFAADRADVAPDDLRDAARTFAAASRGYVVAGVGPNMSASGTLVEYLVLNLETLCGRWLREGEQVHRVPTLMAAAPPKAQAMPPRPGWGYGRTLRVHGLTEMADGLPVGGLADEILLEGEGQIRALLSVGGGPVSAWPDQLKTLEAMRALELLVQVDPWMSQTSRHADYVIAPKMAFEVPGATLVTDWLLSQAGGYYGPEYPHAQYTEAIVDVPADSDLVEEWEFFYGLAQRLGLQLTVNGFVLGNEEPHSLDMKNKPTTDMILEMLTDSGRLTLHDVKQHPHGVSLREPAVFVEPKEDGWEGRLQLADPTMMTDLARVAGTPDPQSDDLPYRLICRRMQRVFNATWNAEWTNRGRGYNPAYMHPDDLRELGLKSGDAVRIRSRRASIPAIVEADETLRRGLVSMAYGFGDAPDRDHEFHEIGSNTNRLLDGSDFLDLYSGQPRMSNVPVAVAALESVHS